MPLILPSKLGGYWIDPPLERLLDVSPTSAHHGLDPEGYDIMERDRDATIYHKFFCSRVSFGVKGCFISPRVIFMFYVFILSAPSIIHSSGSMSGASGSLCVFGGGGEQAAGDTKVEIFSHFGILEVSMAQDVQWIVL